VILLSKECAKTTSWVRISLIIFVLITDNKFDFYNIIEIAAKGIGY
jgi:hypothetical protein